jgi:predicted RNase H-like HicB family nuclease
MTYTYTVALMRETDGGFSVSVPALPGCATEGDSLAEALANASEAIQAYVESLMLDGEPVPADSVSFALEVDETTEVLVRRVTAETRGALAPA